MIIKNHDDFIRRQLFTNSLTIQSSMIQIFSNDNRDIEMVGSGVYIQIQNRLFLITAGHIAEKYRKLLILENEGHMNSIPTEKFGGYKEWADIAIAELKRELIGYTPLTTKQIGNYQKMDKGMPLIGVGFPESQTKIFSKTIDSKMISCITIEASDTEYAEMQAKRDRHIVLTFEKKHMTDFSGKIAEAPKPNGMSGGGVFWIHRKGNFELVKPILIAIMTRWDEIKKKNIVATQIQIINELLKSQYKIDIYG